VASTKSNIIKKKKPVTYLAGLKAITNWVFGKQRKKEDLNNIITTFEIDNKIFKRFLLFTYNSPHITWYINKYLNHLYQFNKFDTTDLINSLTYLLDINRISKKSIPESMLYLKATELNDKNKSNIKKVLEEYFNTSFDKEYNELELNFFYDLINLNLISFDDISQIDKHINSGKSTITLDTTLVPTNSAKINSSIFDVYKEFPPEIKIFCDQVKQYILSRTECKGCELYGKPTVVLDTNMEDGGDVDIMFFGLNPGSEEVEIGKTAVSKSGKVLRERMSLLPPHIKWVITNIILCHTKTEKEIKNFEDVKNRCKELIEGIQQTFPAKVIVPMGAKAADWFGLKGGMVNISGKTFTNNNQQTIIPIIHPSAANYNSNNLDKFKNDFNTILNIFNQSEKQIPSQPTTISIPVVPKKEEQIYIPTDKFINEITPDLTFFDCREVNNQILLIYIDPQGRKKYKLQEYKLQFYLKSSNWRECDQITNEIDTIVQINGFEKGQAIKLVRDKLNSIKK